MALQVNMGSVFFILVAPRVGILFICKTNYDTLVKGYIN